MALSGINVGADTAPDLWREVLKPAPSAWTVGSMKGKAPDARSVTGAVPSAVRVDASGLSVVSAVPPTAEFELIVILRGGTGTRARARILAGVTNEAAGVFGPLGLELNWPDEDASLLRWSLPPAWEKPRVSGAYAVRRLPENRLTWPEAVRQKVESDFAALPDAREKWVRVRCVKRQQRFEVYLDDRLLGILEDARLPAGGGLRLELTEGVELQALDLRAVEPEQARFEQVRLDGYANESAIQGAPLAPEALPRGASITVGGVPFRLAQGDGGPDHINVGVSWVRAGNTEGTISGAAHDMARWYGALDLDPARVQMRFRNGGYSRLHLLAAAVDDPAAVPLVSAQFYRPRAGHPVTFEGAVPRFKAAAPDSPDARAVRLADGSTGRLYRVTLNLDPGGLMSLTDSDVLEMELTKQVQIYRDYPDPTFYSQHGGGRPSAARVFAVTLERPAVEVTLEPTRFAHLWTAPEIPEYRLRLVNHAAEPRRAALALRATSLNGAVSTERALTVDLPAGGRTNLTLALPVTSYGHHEASLRIDDGDGPRTYPFSLAWLHPDTRERGNWEEDHGLRFGFWDWSGQHLTATGLPRLVVMHAVGAESSMLTFNAPAYDGEREWLAAHGMKTSFLTKSFLRMIKQRIGVDWDATKPDLMAERIVDTIRRDPASTPSPVNDPVDAMFFGEPGLGPVTAMSLPHFYGDPPYQLTPEERVKLERFTSQFLIGGRAVRKEWPKARLLMPWGLINFIIPFLWEKPEVIALMDGMAVDMAPFERLPEMQVDQVTLHNEMWQTLQEWKKYAGKPWPRLITVEGPCIAPAGPGALSPETEAAHSVRAILALSAYNVTQVLGWPTPFRCGAYWGESHYGNGLCHPLPLGNPYPGLSAYATLTRQLNRMNYVRWLPTGSHSVFCLQFRHYRTGQTTHVMWTLRGTRPVAVSGVPAPAVTVFDSMDNPAPVAAGKEGAEFQVGTLPVYVQGLGTNPVFRLGPPDHGDSRPAATSRRLGNPGDGAWRVDETPDAAYEASHAEYVRRFPIRMTARSVSAPEAQGGRALEVHLPAPAKERFVMPYYSTLFPPAPIEIPGRASHLGLWAQGHSDWGRVVYVLLDAAGERWTSVGKRDAFNCDDTHAWSRFCFDGWRYLRFELPGHAPYDLFRLAGTTWWGSEGGDGIVQLPLKLEKILVERRTHVVYVNELLPADAGDVLLGDLVAEYEKAEDATPAAVELSRIRMPLPEALPALGNPIARIEAEGRNPPTVIRRLALPERGYDGTSCHLFFDAVEGAAGYDVWVATYPDGRGAVRLGKGWKAPGEILAGLSPNTDYYLFVTWTNGSGVGSRPSAPFRVKLQDLMPLK